MPDRAAAKILTAWTERLEPLYKEASLAGWTASIDATPANTAKVAAAGEAIERACGDADGFAKIGRALEEGVADPLLRRALEKLRDELLPCQGPEAERLRIVELQSSVQERFSTRRGVVRGKALSDNELSKILKESDDAALREEAWRASKEVGAAVAADVRELARLRNRVAQALGFSDHYTMELKRQEIDPSWLDEFLSKTERGTDAAFGRYKTALDARLAKRFAVKPDALRPWHLEDPFFQEAPETGRRSFDGLFAGRDLVALTNRTYDDLGLDVKGSMARSDLLPRAGKNQHAFCTHIDRRGDVRVLCNNVPNERWMGTMLHEFGHAIYDLEIDRALPFVLRAPPHMSSTEAIAMLFGRLSKDASWLAPMLGLSTAEAKEVEASARLAFSEGMLVFARWVLVMARFEKAFYADPERDLDTLWWDLVEKYQRVRRPDGRHAPDWAAKIHIATAPVYYHSYLMGECTASQLVHHMEKTTGRGLVGNRASGTWLRDTFFSPGSKESWNAHLKSATGSALDLSVFLRDIGAAA
jgi:peptidyl-dipeptidase A